MSPSKRNFPHKNTTGDRHTRHLNTQTPQCWLMGGCIALEKTNDFGTGTPLQMKMTRSTIDSVAVNLRCKSHDSVPCQDWGLHWHSCQVLHRRTARRLLRSNWDFQCCAYGAFIKQAPPLHLQAPQSHHKWRMDFLGKATKFRISSQKYPMNTLKFDFITPCSVATLPFEGPEVNTQLHILHVGCSPIWSL